MNSENDVIGNLNNNLLGEPYEYRVELFGNGEDLVTKIQAIQNYAAENRLTTRISYYRVPQFPFSEMLWKKSASAANEDQTEEGLFIICTSIINRGGR